GLLSPTRHCGASLFSILDRGPQQPPSESGGPSIGTSVRSCGTFTSGTSRCARSRWRQRLACSATSDVYAAAREVRGTHAAPTSDTRDRCTRRHDVRHDLRHVPRVRPERTRAAARAPTRDGTSIAAPGTHHFLAPKRHPGPPLPAASHCVSRRPLRTDPAGRL